MRSLLAIGLAVGLAHEAAGTDFPRFEARKIDRNVGEVCYALATADVDGDGRLDIAAATEDAVVWYVNPSWRRRDIIRGKTKPDNVCLQAYDADGDGRVDFAVGAGWGPLGLRGTETLEWVTRTGGDEAWRVVPIEPVPSLHRVRWGDVLGKGRKQLVAAPLQGAGVKEPDWGAGPGVQILVFRVPDKPATTPWPREVADEGLHTAHGLQLVDLDDDGRDEVLVAAWEGLFVLHRDASGRWSREKIGDGHQDEGPSKGASEVRLGRLADGRRWIATLEPWHGHEVVVYTPPKNGKGLWDRTVVDGDVSGAHALWCADLDGDGDDELAVARRDADHDLTTPPNRMGVLVFDPKAEAGPALKFERHVLDDSNAVEDLVGADLDGDGRVDLVAGGRETHDVTIYWNRADRPKARPGSRSAR
jgi:hypothetical protein